MGYFQVRYDSRVINYERKLFIRLVTGYICSEQVGAAFDQVFSIFQLSLIVH